MAQNTNASALIRLRPLENTNTGQLVEEHIRYWRRYKDAGEAQKRAEEARRREFQRKVNKDTFELYDGLTPEENAGFLNAQIIDNFERNKPYYVELAKRASGGDVNAMVQLADEKRKIESATKVNKVYSEKIQALEEQKAKGEFNDVLDTQLDKFKNSLMQGKYRFNPDWSLDIYDPNDDEIIRLSSSALFNNDFLNSQFNKKADFVGNGRTIAQNLLDSEDGTKEVTAQTRLDGIRLVKSLFGQDNVEARTWFGNAKRDGLVDIQTPFGELSEVEKNQLAETYYDQNVATQLEEIIKDSSLDDAIKRQRLANLRKTGQRTQQLIDKGNRDADENRTTISASTDEAGNELIISSIESGTGEELATGRSRVYNLNGKPITFGVKGNSNTNRTFTSLVKDESTGEVYAIGEEVQKVQVPLTNADGSVQTDANGNEKTTTREQVVPIVENDKAILNNIARQIESNEGNNLKNLSELDLLLNDLTKEVNPKANTKRKIKGF